MEHRRPTWPNVLHLHQREPVPQQWYRLPDSHAYCHANGDANTDFNAYSYGHVYGYTNSDTYADFNANSHGHVYSNADGDAYTDCNANSDCYGDVHADGYSNSDGNANTDGNADSDSYSYVHADGYGDSNSNSHGNSDLNAYSNRGEANTDAEAASNNTATASVVGSRKWNS